jgi:serpin B
MALPTAGTVREIAAGNSRFALDLYARLRGRTGNLFFSPLSISTALAMTSAGARGETAEQMARTLHLSLGDADAHAAVGSLLRELCEHGDSAKLELRLANALWVGKGYRIVADFRRLLAEQYAAEAREVDFGVPAEACRLINSWVETQTRDKIRNLLSPRSISELTRLILTNAIYFKAEWEKKFERRNTKDADFHVGPGLSERVAMMFQEDHFAYYDWRSFQLLALPYLGGRLAMLVLLPRQRDGLAALESELTPANLAKWPLYLRSTLARVHFPRFRIDSGCSLGSLLPPMGMPVAFDPGHADFSGITGGKDLSVSEVIHQAYVDVSEEGTEAAAATAVVMDVLGMSEEPEEPVVFRADRPFLFLIRDNLSGSVLFLGRVADPRQ